MWGELSLCQWPQWTSCVRVQDLLHSDVLSSLLGGLNIHLIFKFLWPAGGAFVHVISLCFIKSCNEKKLTNLWHLVLRLLKFLLQVWVCLYFFPYFELSFDSVFEIFWQDTFNTKKFGLCPNNLMGEATVPSLSQNIGKHQMNFGSTLITSIFLYSSSSRKAFLSHGEWLVHTATTLCCCSPQISHQHQKITLKMRHWRWSTHSTSIHCPQEYCLVWYNTFYSYLEKEDEQHWSKSGILVRACTLF